MTENPFYCVPYSVIHRAWNRGRAVGKVEGYNQALIDLRKRATSSLSIGTKLWDSESIRISLKLNAEALKKVSE